MRSLVIGRFQPLHLGHMRMIGYVAERSDALAVGVGSRDAGRSADNPFTFEERKLMLEKSLDLPIPYEVEGIPDFGDDGEWMEWIKNNVKFDVFWTNSPNERRIFEEAGLKVQEIPFFDRGTYSATEVRRRIIEDGDWTSLLPEGTITVLGRIDGIYRIKKLSSRT